MTNCVTHKITKYVHTKYQGQCHEFLAGQVELLQSRENLGKEAMKFYKYIMLVGNPHSVVCAHTCVACQHYRGLGTCPVSLEIESESRFLTL